jgi:hypothetical protein
MYPYLAMLAVPGGLALRGRRAERLWLLLIALVYFLMIGFRFRVGMDWNNYIDIYGMKKGWSFAKFIFSREPGFGLLMWISARTGLGVIFLNVVSAAVFCWGFFSVAKRCREPWLAVSIATPMLVIAFAMSGIRQAIAVGILFYLFAHWENRRTFNRLLLVMLASAFHFSAIFMLIFVALGSNASYLIRLAGAVLVAILVVAVVQFAPAAVEAYSRLYLTSGGKLTAPGAIFQITPLAIAALLYFAAGEGWRRVNGDSPLQHGMAWAALFAVPAIFLSSVGAYRFGLYLWPMAMTVYGGFPETIQSGVGRLFYRICVVAAAFAMLIGWLFLANNSYGWIPYQNWLTQPDGAMLWRSHYR